MWFLLKMSFWKCDFCEKMAYKNVNFVKHVILKMWIFWKSWFWTCEFLDENCDFAPVCSKERPPANFKPKSYQHREHEVLFLNEIMDMFKNIIFFPCSNRKVLLDCQLNVNCQWTIESLFVPNLNLICADFLSFSDAILKIAIFLFDFFPIFFFF